MKSFIRIMWLTGFILTINNCVIFNAGAVLLANKEINATVLSTENEYFQQAAGINLAYVKRGLWSMQSTFKNKTIEKYYRSLLDNRLTFVLNIVV